MACWPLERKHKTPKRYGSDICNTAAYENSLLHEVTCAQLARLEDQSLFDSMKCRLIQPRTATRNVKAFILNILWLIVETHIDCNMSGRCRCSESLICSVGDVVLVKTLSGSLKAGEFWALIEVDGELLAVMTMWKLTALHHGTANWELSEQCELVYGDEILEALTWTRHSDTLAKTLLPPWYRWCHLDFRDAHAAMEKKVSQWKTNCKFKNIELVLHMMSTLKIICALQALTSFY